MIASTPKPPYYAVIFTSIRSMDDNEYAATSEQMEQSAKKQPGYLGIESARGEIGITVSYWDSLDAIKKWKADIEHLEAQKKGREKWYAQYKTRICLVERDYGFSNDSKEQ